MKTRILPTQNELLDIFDYQDGVLIWKMRTSKHTNDARFNTRCAGKAAGCKKTSTGYINIRLNNAIYLAHRLVYVYHHGDCLDGKNIDHIDGNRTNNRIENLRVATTKENTQNRGKQKNNTTGFKGVTYHHKDRKYQAQIHSNGKMLFLGYYDTPELASAAYVIAAQKEHGDFLHSSIRAMGKGEK
jgi:hypothetical protein